MHRVPVNDITTLAAKAAKFNTFKYLTPDHYEPSLSPFSLPFSFLCQHVLIVCSFRFGDQRLHSVSSFAPPGDLPMIEEARAEHILSLPLEQIKSPRKVCGGRDSRHGTDTGDTDLASKYPELSTYNAATWVNH
jgi:hypothetical protein